MKDFEIKKYKTRNVITLYKNDYRSLFKAIIKGSCLSLDKDTFVRLNLKDKKRFEKMTVGEYSNNKAFKFFNITFKPKNNHDKQLLFISTKNFLGEDIVLNNGYLIIREQQTLMSVFNKLSASLQFIVTYPLNDKQLAEFNKLE